MTAASLFLLMLHITQQHYDHHHHYYCGFSAFFNVNMG